MTGLLFVNRTGSSKNLSGSSQSESAVIMSHVQRNRRKAEGRSQNKPWSSLESVLAPRSEKYKYQESYANKKNNGYETAPAASLSSTSPIELPRTYPTSNAHDPFHCTVVGNEAGTHELLRYTFFSLARANFLAEAFAPPLGDSSLKIHYINLLVDTMQFSPKDSSIASKIGSSCIPRLHTAPAW